MPRNYNSQMAHDLPCADILLGAFGRTYLTAFIFVLNILGNSSIGKLGSQYFGCFFLGEVNLN